MDATAMLDELAAAPRAGGEDDPLARQVGDVVALRHDLSGRSRLLRAGARGVVCVTGLAWGGYSVEFGSGAASRLFQLAPRHVELIERAQPAGGDAG